MRYFLATILVCSLGVPAASALPAAGSALLSAPKAAPVTQAAARSRPHAHRQSRKDNGIHPLVGSGDY
jgi:hypothetical protein